LERRIRRVVLVGRGRRGWEECLTVGRVERKSRRIVRMGRGEWEKRVIRWEVGEKDKEGGLSGKGEKRMGRMLTGGTVGEKEQENN
jgi:hypothetical protein